MDLLQIKGLRIDTRIGIHAWEQKLLQTLLIDIEIPINTENCHDQIVNTIDYDKLCQKLSAYITNNSFNLIETVANHVANLITKEFKVNKLTVTVSKPFAIQNAANISITIRRC